MSKIAIISQAEQGVLIDISGCNSLSEAKQYLTSTLQVSSQFWDGLTVDLNLGPLALTPDEVSEILAIVSEVGVRPKQIFAADQGTRASIIASRANIGMVPFESVRTNPENETTETEEAIEVSEINEESYTPNAKEQALDTLEILKESVAGIEIEMSSPVISSQAPIIEEFTEFTGKEIETQSEKTALKTENKPAKGKAAPGKTGERAPQVLFLKQTLRSGQAISHKGHLVIVGDVNPGAEIMAEGDITIWGALRGMAHAGVGGNINAEIRALKFEPIQLRIAHAIARAPDKLKSAALSSSGPETARIINGKIRISATDLE